jgi:hypothetical protein
MEMLHRCEWPALLGSEFSELILLRERDDRTQISFAYVDLRLPTFGLGFQALDETTTICAFELALCCSAIVVMAHYALAVD